MATLPGCWPIGVSCSLRGAAWVGYMGENIITVGTPGSSCQSNGRLTGFSGGVLGERFVCFVCVCVYGCGGAGGAVMRRKFFSLVVGRHVVLHRAVSARTCVSVVDRSIRWVGRHFAMLKTNGKKKKKREKLLRGRSVSRFTLHKRTDECGNTDSVDKRKWLNTVDCFQLRISRSS